MTLCDTGCVTRLCDTGLLWLRPAWCRDSFREPALLSQGERLALPAELPYSRTLAKALPVSTGPGGPERGESVPALLAFLSNEKSRGTAVTQGQAGPAPRARPRGWVGRRAPALGKTGKLRAEGNFGRVFTEGSRRAAGEPSPVCAPPHMLSQRVP